MIVNSYPVKFEAVDINNDLVFSIEAFDAVTASVSIKSLVTPETWPDISAEIQKCLDAMNLVEE